MRPTSENKCSRQFLDRTAGERLPPTCWCSGRLALLLNDARVEDDRDPYYV